MPTDAKPKTAEAKDFLQVFDNFGITLSPNGSGEGIGDCPFCSKEAHFYANASTGHWCCKVCDESGNLPTFLQKFHAYAAEQTEAADYAELSKDRGIPADELQTWGLAKSPINGEWLLPVYNGKRKIANLRRYTGAKPRFFSTKNCSNHLCGDREPTSSQRTLWVAEGEWDGMALRSILRKLKDPKTGKPLADTNAVVVVPGATNLCKEELVPLAKQMAKVHLCFDSDHPKTTCHGCKQSRPAKAKVCPYCNANKTTGKISTPGWDGARKAAKLLQTKGKRPGLYLLRWGREGFDPKRKSGFDLRDLITDLGPEAAYAYVCERLEEAEESSPESAPEANPVTFPVYTWAELCNLEDDHNYLVDSVLAENQPCIIFGPSKCMKTTLAVDMSISLATGNPFLGYFDCKPSRTLLMSGESGRKTIMETARRMANAYGLDLDAIAGNHWHYSPALPLFKEESHHKALGQLIAEREIKVVIIDPAYKCMDVDGRESNLFAMGRQLNSIGKVCEENGATFVLLHHTNKDLKPGRAATLSDIAWAGFQQYFRQWIGVNRRKPHKIGSGIHELLIAPGGSMGHSSQYAVEIKEGTNNGNQRRYWECTVTPKSAAEGEDEGDRKVKLHALRITEFLKSKPNGDTQTRIAAGTRLSSEKAKAALAYLESAGKVRAFKIAKNNRQLPAYRLSASKPSPKPIKTKPK